MLLVLALVWNLGCRFCASLERLLVSLHYKPINKFIYFIKYTVFFTHFVEFSIGGQICTPWVTPSWILEKNPTRELLLSVRLWSPASSARCRGSSRGGRPCSGGRGRRSQPGNKLEMEGCQSEESQCLNWNQKLVGIEGSCFSLDW